jgi:phosphoribosyl 1,2-cyclic phosphate phosphodiesterase
MNSIKITFLGTGTSQGVPVIACKCAVCTSADSRDTRTRTSILVETSETRIVIDTGPDFRQQCLREKLTKLDAVLFTHEHKDHIAGLDEVRAFNFINKMVMPVYATAQVNKALQREFAYIFSEDKYPGIPQIEVIGFGDEKFSIGDLTIIPVNVKHYMMDVKAFRINDFAYVTDANLIDETERQKLKNLDVLVLNSLRREPHISHFTFAEAMQVVKELVPKKAYFTHISHQLGLHEAVNKELPSNIELAFDGLQLVI